MIDVNLFIEFIWINAADFLIIIFIIVGLRFINPYLTVRLMSDSDLLEEVFLKMGEKQGLDEQLLRDILAILDRDKFVPSGQRSHTRADLEKVVRSFVKGGN